MNGAAILIRNEPDWLPDSRERASKLFGNQRLQQWATMLASTHPRAVDYITQAPVLVLAACAGRRTDVRGREIICRTFGSLSERGPKLNEIMRLHGLRLPMRALKGSSLAPSYFPLLKLFVTVHPSALALSIPDKGQLAWVRTLDLYRRAFDARGRQVERFEWAVIRSSREPRAGQTDPRTIVDYIVAGEPFDERWTWTNAVSAAGRWHGRLRLQKTGASFGIGPDTQIDFGEHPDRARHRHLTFVALRTAEAVAEEGALMHHCVASYIRDVLDGRSHIVSVREGDRRIATLDLRKQGGCFFPSQFSGPCNRRVPGHHSEAMNEYVAAINEAAA